MTSGNLGGKFLAQLDDDAALLRQRAPARLRELEHLVDGAVNVEPGERARELARPVELAHALDGAGDIVDRAPHRDQAAAAGFGDLRFLAEQQLRVQRHGRNGVVDVMRDAARHFAERAQTFGLHHGLLAVTQILIGALQCAVQLRLVRRQCHVRAELFEKFAISTGEGFLLAAHGDQHSENIRFHGKRRNDQRMESRVREPARERRVQARGVGLMDQGAVHRPIQAVFPHRHRAAQRQSQRFAGRVACCPDAFDHDRAGCGVAQAHAPEIDGQVFLQAAQHHLENAFQVVPRANAVSNFLQQREPVHLGAHALFVLLGLHEHVIERVGEIVELIDAGETRAYAVIVPVGDQSRGGGELENRRRQHCLQAP